MSPRSDSSSVSIVLASEKLKGNTICPALATFPDVPPDPTNTQFGLYIHQSNDKLPALLLGQNNELEFRSDTPVNQTNCTYMFGLHLPESGELTLFPTRFYQLRPLVKRLRDLDNTRSSQLPINNFAARTSLGTTFGTKKARRAIQAAARSRVDPETMSHLENQISSTIAKSSSCLPTAQVQAEEADAGRPIPAFNKEATIPQDVYPLSNVVSSLELNSIPIDSILNAPSAQAASLLLPSPNSKFVNSRLRTLWNQHPDGKLDKQEIKRLRILIYLNYLISIRHLRNLSRDSISRRLSPRSRSSSSSSSTTVPDSIIEGILSRFTEAAQAVDGTTQYQMTSFTNLKLLSYIAVLCLIHDDFFTRVFGLAEDLQEPTSRINTIFESLGCRMTKLKVAEVEALDGAPLTIDPKESIAQRTLAKLVVPLTFPAPKPTRKRRPNNQ